MTTSAQLSIRDAVATLFTGLAQAVHENRDHPLAERAASQIGVYRTLSTPERILLGVGAPIDWTTDVRVVIKARTMDGTSAETTADGIACDCYAALMADQTLGGLAQLTELGPIVWDQDEADHQVVVAVMDFRFVHRTLGTTLAAP